MLDLGTQTRLKDKGFYKGSLDGKFGPLSYGSLIGYAAGRVPDGGILARGELAALKYPSYGLTTDPYQLAEFLAQLTIESKNFTATRENLNYSADGLLSTFGPGHGSRIKNRAEANALARKPQAIANKVYGGRMGNTGPNDGWLYRGAFDIQLTGKSNWIKYAPPGVDLLENADEHVNDPELCHWIALQFWSINKVPAAVKDRDFLGARKIVNLGSRTSKGTPHGVEAVRVNRERILKILGA
jgi:putative chitinase